MDLQELNQLLSAKTLQYDVSIETGVPHAELLQLYKEIKELKYQILMAETEKSRQEIA